MMTIIISYKTSDGKCDEHANAEKCWKSSRNAWNQPAHIETCPWTGTLWSPTFAIQPLVQQCSAKISLLGFAATKSTIDFLPAVEGLVILRSLFKKAGTRFFFPPFCKIFPHDKFGWRSEGADKSSWNTAGLRMSSENSQRQSLLCRNPSSRIWAVVKKKIVVLHCTALPLQADFCRSWAFRGQPSHQPVSWVELAPQQVLAALHFDCSLHQMVALQAINFIQSLHAAFLWKVLLLNKA